MNHLLPSYLEVRLNLVRNLKELPINNPLFSY